MYSSRNTFDKFDYAQCTNAAGQPHPNDASFYMNCRNDKYHCRTKANDEQTENLRWLFRTQSWKR